MSRAEQRTAFEKTIRENPRDLTTYRVFADWLEEFGDRPGDDDLALWHRNWTLEKQDAKEWLEDFASQCGGTASGFSWEEGYQDWQKITYEDVIRIGHTFIERGDYFIQQGSETARSLIWKKNVRELFWKNWSLVTGVPVGEETRQDSPFSCSC